MKRGLQKDTDVNSTNGLWYTTTGILGLPGGDLNDCPLISTSRPEMAMDATLTATISVPMKEKAAAETTLHHPTNLPVAPGMSLYWTNGPGCFQ